MSIQLQILDIFTWLLLGGSAAGMIYLWHSCRCVERFAAEQRATAHAAAAQAVTILKPLHGEDAQLFENLRSFCRQDYPSFQLVFGVADSQDPALAAVRRLCAECPEADIALVVDSNQAGANLKIANLRNMLRAARHDLLVIADSDMRVAPGYLSAVTAPLREPVQPAGEAPRTGLVTCLYRGVSSGGLWSDLGAMHINYGFLPQAVLARSLGAGAGCFGATMVLKRATLEAVGGFESLADTLADDHALGAAVRRLGLGVTVSPYLVDDIVAEPGLAALFRHELRWARTIRLVAPAGFLGSVVTMPVPLALLAVCLGAGPWIAPVGLVLALVCRGVTARRIDRVLGVASVPFWLLPLRDLLSFAVFLVSFLGRGVAWRDKRFRVGGSGKMTIDNRSPI